MRGKQLPKPISECVETTYYEEVTYFDVVTQPLLPGLYGYSSRKNAAKTYSGQEYKTVVTLKKVEKLPEYKDYNIALPRPVKVKEETIQVIEEKLDLLGF